MKLRLMHTALLLIMSCAFSVAQDYTLIAHEDQYTISWDSVLNVAAPGILQNDIVPEGDTITTTVASQPMLGELVLNNDGSFTFTPEINAQGPVSFVYGIENQNGERSFSTVTINVTPGNKAPLAIDDYYTTLATQRLTVPAPGVLGNDLDLDGDLLSAELISPVGVGIMNLNPDGSFWIEPNRYYPGNYYFTYRVIDARGGVAEGRAWVTIVSHNPPVANPDHLEAFIDQTVPLYVLANDSDPDSNPIRLVSVTQPDIGSVEIDRTVVLFTAGPEDLGRTHFNYTITDGVFEATTTVTVDITDGDEPPVVVNDLVNVNIGETVRFNPLANDYDPNGRFLNLSWLEQPQFGSLRRQGDYEYTPFEDSEGRTETLTYAVSDGYHTVEGVVTIVIGSVNNPPVVNNERATVPLERVINPYNVLANDIDPDGDDLTIARFATRGSADYLNILLNSDQKTFSFQVFRPGTYTVDYWVTDGQYEVPGVLEIFVDGPTENIARDDNYTVVQGQSLTLNTFANDVYFEHSRFTPPEHTARVPGMLTYSNGNFQYFAMSPYIGEIQFTYTLPGGSTATVTINIIPAD